MYKGIKRKRLARGMEERNNYTDIKERKRREDKIRNYRSVTLIPSMLCTINYIL